MYLYHYHLVLWLMDNIIHHLIMKMFQHCKKWSTINTMDALVSPYNSIHGIFSVPQAWHHHQHHPEAWPVKHLLGLCSRHATLDCGAKLFQTQTMLFSEHPKYHCTTTDLQWKWRHHAFGDIFNYVSQPLGHRKFPINQWLMDRLIACLIMTRWWLNQPIWKICSSNWIISLNRGENKRYFKPPPR